MVTPDDDDDPIIVKKWGKGGRGGNVDLPPPARNPGAAMEEGLSSKFSRDIKTLKADLHHVNMNGDEDEKVKVLNNIFLQEDFSVTSAFCWRPLYTLSFSRNPSSKPPSLSLGRW